MKISVRLRNGLGLVAGAIFLAAAAQGGEPNPADGHWVGTWVTAPQLTEPGNMPPPPGLAGNTLRQIIQPALSGNRVRVTFSNAFGDGPVTIAAAQLAVSAGNSAILPESARQLTFDSAASVTIQPGTVAVSDPSPFAVAAFTNLAVTLHLGAVPAGLTGHPGSRTTSFIQTGDQVAAAALPEATRTDHWSLLNGIDVWTGPTTAAIVVLGDSITDGRGSTTNQNNRWPNHFARRLQANADTAHLAVLNQGIGGNRVLRDGLGPHALARFDRDVLGQAGVRWLIVLEGVNDLGTAVGARARREPAATAQELIDAYRQMIAKAHHHGIRVYGGTIMPFEGFAAYYTPESEADRQTVNHWIRTSGEFDGVIDFDAITRDPAHPLRLSRAVDGGDHLHPSAAGHQLMAEGIDLTLFAR